MRFRAANGKNYQVDFTRAYQQVKAVVKRKVDVEVDGAKHRVQISEEKEVQSTHPYTTANLYELGADNRASEKIASATVGCAVGDKFSKEQGRVLALRAITEGLAGIEAHVKPKLYWDLVPRMWEAYGNRFGA